MNHMWSLCIFLLACAFGIPVPSLNDMRQHDQNTVNVQSADKQDNFTSYKSHVPMNDTVGNSTLHPQSNGTRNDTERTPYMVFLPMPDMETSPDVITLQGTSACRLPTCATVNLGSSMQYGDQTAGDATKDPYGNGKK